MSGYARNQGSGPRTEPADANLTYGASRTWRQAGGRSAILSGGFGLGGIGAGFSKDFTADRSMAAGLAETGGLGMEIAMSPGLYLAPELFYRNANLNGAVNVQSIGLQLGIAYY